MSSEFPVGPTPVLLHEFHRLRDQWVWFLVLGILLIVLGTLALGAAVFFTLATVVFFGVLMAMAGVFQIVGAFWAGQWTGFLLNLMFGVFYLVLGVLLIDAPVEGAEALTLMMAAFFIVGGIVRIVGPLVLRFHNWAWPMLNGFITLLLGLLIYRQWPASGLWVIGMFLGIEMIFNGWTWVMLALNVRAIPKSTAA